MRPVARVLTYAALGFWALVCLVPLYWMITLSFKQPADVISGPHYLAFVDFKPTLDAWRYILFNPDDDSLKRYLNSIVIATGATGLTLSLGALATYGLTRLRSALTVRTGVFVLAAVALSSAAALAGPSSTLVLTAVISAVAVVLVSWLPTGQRIVDRDHVFLAMVATRVLPPVVTLLPVYFMAQRVGLLDTRSAVIFTYTAANLPVAIWLLRGFFDEIPKEIDDAGQIDGASRFRILVSLILPLARGGLAATALLIFILCWNEYLYAAYLTTDHALTMPPFLAGQMATREQMASADPEWGYFSVLIVLMVAPLVAFMGVLQRLAARTGGATSRRTPA